MAVANETKDEIFDFKGQGITFTRIFCLSANHYAVFGHIRAS